MPRKKFVWKGKKWGGGRKEENKSQQFGLCVTELCNADDVGDASLSRVPGCDNMFFKFKRLARLSQILSLDCTKF